MEFTLQIIFFHTLTLLVSNFFQLLFIAFILISISIFYGSIRKIQDKVRKKKLFLVFKIYLASLFVILIGLYLTIYSPYKNKQPQLIEIANPVRKYILKHYINEDKLPSMKNILNQIAKKCDIKDSINKIKPDSIFGETKDFYFSSSFFTTIMYDVKMYNFYDITCKLSDDNIKVDFHIETKEINKHKNYQFQENLEKFSKTKHKLNEDYYHIIRNFKNNPSHFFSIKLEVTTKANTATFEVKPLNLKKIKKSLNSTFSEDNLTSSNTKKNDKTFFIYPDFTISH